MDWRPIVQWLLETDTSSTEHVKLKQEPMDSEDGWIKSSGPLNWEEDPSCFFSKKLTDPVYPALVPVMLGEKHI